MSYITNNPLTSTVDAVLTRLGKSYMVSNDESFAITQFAVADDEMNYGILSIANITQDDEGLLSIPISEPSTNGSSEMINKVWVNQTFNNTNQFLTNTVLQGQRVAIETEQGNTLSLFSNDTTQKIRIWFSTMDALNRPEVGDFYDIKFTSTIDFFTINFESPVFLNSSSTSSLNYTQLSNTEYIFNAVNNDGSGRYTANSYGSPCIVLDVSFTPTPLYYQMIAQPQNTTSISVPTFLTVTQIDSTQTSIPNIASASIPLQVLNILS